MARKSPAKRASSKKAVQAPKKKSPAGKTTLKKTPAKNTPAKKASAKKTAAKKSPGSQSTAKNAPDRKISSKKNTAKKKAGRAKPVANKQSTIRPVSGYWLVKSEPHVFSIDDLANSSGQTTHWDGVRNYQARNTMRDDMKVGDQVLFYHSNAQPPGIAGVAKVVVEGYPDHTAFDAKDKHYDPKSKKSEPTWYMVDVQLVEKFEEELSLPMLKQVPELRDMVLLQRGSRLSVQPVSASEFKTIVDLGRQSTAS